MTKSEFASCRPFGQDYEVIMPLPIKEARL